MTDATAPAADKPKGKKALIFAALLALIGGGAGFYATFSGLILGAPPAAEAPEFVVPAGPIGSFVRIEPITVNLQAAGTTRHLRFSAQLEVVPTHAEEVARLMPRILDVMNTYLRALDAHELEEPAALLRLRGQMLRRVQVVTGPGHVRDILITEFVFN